MAHNERSRHVTEGDVRAPNRSMYYPMGYTRADFDKPMIGVANGHSTITPCNAGLQKLADAAIDAIEEAGGKAQVFGTPTVSDAVSMGTEGMKYSLVSREVIADCIEVAVMGQWMDGCVVVGGCDKNMPGGMIAMARTNVPSIYVYGGTIKPGRHDGHDLTVVSVFEAVGEFAAGRLSRPDFEAIEEKACPTAGSCGGMYTANTMSSSFEALGLSLLGSSSMANPDDEKTGSAAESARVLVEAVKANRRPRDIITKKSIENAVARDHGDRRLDQCRAAFSGYRPCGGSGMERSTTSSACGKKVPVICNLKPSGQLRGDRSASSAGGIPQVLKMLARRRSCCTAIASRSPASTIAEELEGRAVEATR